MSDKKPQPTPINAVEWMADPHAVFARHRAESWWAPFAGYPIAEVLEYHAVKELLAADTRFGAYNGGCARDVMRQNPALSEEHIEAMCESSERALINMDGPEHHRLRAFVARAFTPRSVAQLAPYVETLAQELALSLQSGDDFMQTFARSLPARALCLLTGIPGADHDRFVGWIDLLEVQASPQNLATLTREESVAVLAANNELRAYCRDLIALRRDRPEDDLISRFIQEAGADIDDATMVQLLVDLIFAGNDTTRNALGLMVMGLVHHPEIWERVAVDPVYAPAVVEEVLRLHSPAPGPVRRACTRFEYRDHAFAEGDVAALSSWSANRDEAFWGPSASAFDPDRAESGQHLSFGQGPHFCLGASLAREEMRAALVALAQQLTNIRVVGTPTMHPVGSIYGPIALPIVFDRRGG